MTPHLRLINVALLAVITAGSATALTVTVSTHGTAAAGPLKAKATVTFTDASGGPAKRAARSVEISAPASVAVELPAGVWMAEARADGFLPAQATVNTATQPTMSLALWQATHVVGSIRPTRGDAITALTLTYEATKPPADGPSPSGTVDCLIRERTFDCPAPVGTIDYNLHARGFASVFYWGDRLSADRTRDLGPLTFVRGASLIGRVMTAHGLRAPQAPVEVTLRQAGFTVQGDDARRGKLMDRKARANERGFFQFDGLPPGKYDVRASSGALVSEAVAVTIIDGAEAALRGTLVLDRPKRVRVQITPALDPGGKPWTVELHAMNYAANHRRLVATGSADFGGTWTEDEVLPGSYSVSVRREPQAAWYQKDLEVVDDTDVAVDITQVTVKGRVRLGEKPVQGFLWFGGDRAPVSIPVPTNEDGHFEAVLPPVENDTWPEIDVVSEHPPLRRALYDVKLRRTDDPTHALELEIDLPARGIFGQVVMKGKPLSHAQVFLSATGSRMVDVLTGEDGGFAFDGLEPGDYTLRASIDADRRSQPAHVSLSEADRAQTVELVIDDVTTIEGRLSSAGRPLAGGRVWSIPADRSAATVVPTETKLDGTFTLAAPSSASHFCFAAVAPGFGFSFGDVRLPVQYMNAELLPVAATLILEAADHERHRAENLMPMLLHRQTFLHVALIAALSASADVREVDGVRRTTLLVEPGEYALCYGRMIPGTETHVATQDCQRGIAIAGGTLSLAIDGR